MVGLFNISVLDINNGLVLCYGYCGDSTYANKTITLPIVYNQIFSAISSTKNTTNALCNRIEIKNLSTLYFSRADVYNVTGWYFIIGI